MGELAGGRSIANGATPSTLSIQRIFIFYFLLIIFLCLSLKLSDKMLLSGNFSVASLLCFLSVAVIGKFMGKLPWQTEGVTAQGNYPMLLETNRLSSTYGKIYE